MAHPRFNEGSMSKNVVDLENAYHRFSQDVRDIKELMFGDEAFLAKKKDAFDLLLQAIQKNPKAVRWTMKSLGRQQRHAREAINDFAHLLNSQLGQIAKARAELNREKSDVTEIIETVGTAIALYNDEIGQDELAERNIHKAVSSIKHDSQHIIENKQLYESFKQLYESAREDGQLATTVEEESRAQVHEEELKIHIVETLRTTIETQIHLINKIREAYEDQVGSSSNKGLPDVKRYTDEMARLMTIEVSKTAVLLRYEAAEKHLLTDTNGLALRMASTNKHLHQFRQTVKWFRRRGVTLAAVFALSTAYVTGNPVVRWVVDGNQRPHVQSEYTPHEGDSIWNAARNWAGKTGFEIRQDAVRISNRTVERVNSAFVNSIDRALEWTAQQGPIYRYGGAGVLHAVRAISKHPRTGTVLIIAILLRIPLGTLPLAGGILLKFDRQFMNGLRLLATKDVVGGMNVLGSWIRKNKRLAEEIEENPRIVHDLEDALIAHFERRLNQPRFREAALKHLDTKST